MGRMKILPERWKAFLIDLDGTLYHGTRMIPGADRLVSALLDKKIPFLFVTNNSSRTPEQVAGRLRAMGIPAKAEDVCTSAVAAAEYIAGELPAGVKVAAIGEAGLLTALPECGAAAGRGTAGCGRPGNRPQFYIRNVDQSGPLDRRGRQVRADESRSAAALDGRFDAGSGDAVRRNSSGYGVKPVVIGKPAEPLMNFAIKRLGLRNEEVAVIGDNMLTDIAAGVNAGCGTILTLTGVTTEERLPDAIKTSGFRPDAVCRNLDEVAGLIG